MWTDPALDDVEGIALFIARDSPHYAARIVEDFMAMADQLQAFPLSGRTVPEVDREDIRERIVGTYRLIYHVSDTTVSILAVIHVKRDLSAEAGRLTL